MHLLVNELCEYQNARCNDKKINIFIFLSCGLFLYILVVVFDGSTSVCFKTILHSGMTFTKENKITQSVENIQYKVFENKKQISTAVVEQLSY